MKNIAAILAVVSLSACGSITEPGSLNRKIDEATYKHYPNLSEAKRAECRAKGDAHYYENATGGSPVGYTARARLEAANIYEACMEKS